MNKLIIVSFFFLIISALSVNAQQEQAKYPFVESVKAKVEDSTSAFAYKKLLSKIKIEPGNVTQQELFHLYYGQIFLKKPRGMPFLTDGMDDFIKAVVKRKSKLIVELGLKMLNENPVDLTILMHTALALQKTKQPDTAFLDKRVKMLFDVILSTGDGKTKETPIKIADIQDSTIIKNFIGFKSDSEVIETYNGIPLTAWTNGDQKLYIENTWAHL